MKNTPCLLFAVLLLMTLFGCSQNRVKNENGFVKKVININVDNNYTAVILQIIKIKDLLAPLLPDDVIVEWSALQSGLNMRDAMVAGSVDIAAPASSFVIPAIENGLPLRIISNGTSGNARLISTKEHINSVSDLTANSRITVSSIGSIPHMQFVLHCRDILGNASIFNNGLVSVPNVDAIALMQTSRDYDAFILSFPSYSLLPLGFDYHIIGDLTQTAVKYNIGSYITTTDEFGRNNPVLLKAFKTASERAVDLLLNKTDEMAILLADFYDVDAVLIADVIRECPPKLEISGYDDISALMLELGILSKPPKKFSELPNYDEIPKE